MAPAGIGFKDFPAGVRILVKIFLSQPNYFIFTSKV